MKSFNEVWNMVRDYCRERMSEVAFNVWIDVLTPVKFENETAYLSVRSEFQKNIICDKYLPTIKDALEGIFGFPVGVVIETSDRENEEGEPDFEEEPAQPAVIQRDESDDDSYAYVFDNFIVGSSNKFAYAAAVAVASTPGSTYNPLFIYGNSGLGKTHLLNAICHKVKQDNPSAKVIYTRGEDFTNEIINGLATKKMDEFHRKYRSADVLLVDDIQFIGGKVQTQEEFFHTFNALYQDGKQIVVTSDRTPKEIQTLEERLRTRFEWGLLADIYPPDFETRMAIIKRKAQMLDIQISDDIVQYIAEKVKANIRQLEGVVKKLKAYHNLEGHSPTIIIAQNAIKDILTDNQPVPVTVEKIISEVASTYGVTSEDIRSSKRASNISKARQVAMYVVRNITPLSMEAIGEEFGGRDHATVVYALNQVKKNMETDSKVKATVTDIIKNIQDQ